MKKEKQFLNEIALKLGKVYTAKDNPPFQVTEYTSKLVPSQKSKIVPDPDKINKLVPNPDGTNTLVPTQQSKLVPDQEVVPNTLLKILDEPPENVPPLDKDKTPVDKDKSPTKALTGPKLGKPLGATAAALTLGGGLAAYKGLKALKKYRDKKRKEKQNDNYTPSGALISEGPSYEYRKHTNKIAKSMKQHQGAVLDFYEMLRKKGLDKEAAMLLDAYKKNLVTFKKSYDVLMRKLV